MSMLILTGSQIIPIHLSCPTPRVGAIKRWCASDVCLSDACLSVACIGPKSRTERPRKTKIGTEKAHVTRDSNTTFRVKRSKVNLQGAGTYCGGLSHSLLNHCATKLPYRFIAFAFLLEIMQESFDVTENTVSSHSIRSNTVSYSTLRVLMYGDFRCNLFQKQPWTGMGMGMKCCHGNGWEWEGLEQ